MVAQLPRVQVLIVSSSLAIASLAACGVRSPLGDVATGLDVTPLEARSDGGKALARSEKSADSGAGGDAEAAPTCAKRLASCEADSACVSILNCVLLDCAAANASAQMTCAFGCSAGNFNELTAMLPLFSCLQAGADGGAPGGLGGLLAGGGDSGGLGALGALLGNLGGAFGGRAAGAGASGSSGGSGG